VVLVLAIVRRKMVEHEDDTLKLAEGEVSEVKQQTELATKLERVEMWGKSLTILLVVSGIGLGVWYGLQLWNATSTVGLH
jgi:hypothetical protein